MHHQRIASTCIYFAQLQHLVSTSFLIVLLAAMGKQNLEIAKPITLPCGLTLPNRLVKAAMAEGWSGRDKLASRGLMETYRLWANGGWGMIMTGNVQVDATYLGTMDDVTINERLTRKKHIESFGEWAKITSEYGTPGIVQLSHPGRQSTIGAGTKGFFGKSIGPSAIPVNLGPGLIAQASSAFVFGTPREMSDLEIEDVVRRFATAAKIMEEAGFAGVEIHAAHGYLLSSFLSARHNKRTDEYGGSAKARAKIVVDVLKAVRAAVSPKFCVGVKVNSVDHQSPGELQDCLEQLSEITKTGIDFLEISGGSYEDPTVRLIFFFPFCSLGLPLTNSSKMMESTTAEETTKVSASTAARESFFIDFAKAIRKTFPKLHLLVTGGFRTRLGLEYAVKSGGCDLVGMARASVMQPALPKIIIFDEAVSDEDARVRTKSFTQPTLGRYLGVKGISGGTETVCLSFAIPYSIRSAQDN